MDFQSLFKDLNLSTADKNRLSEYAQSGDLEAAQRLLMSAMNKPNTSPLFSDPNNIKDEIEQIQKRFEEERSQKPSPIPRMETSWLIRAWQNNRDDHSQKMKENGFSINKTYSGDHLYFCSQPMSQLTRIELSEMKVRQVHRGRYFLCRIAVLPWVTVGVTLGIIDPSGMGMTLGIYNYPLLPTSQGIPSTHDYDGVFSVGTILCIKEPFCKKAMTGDSYLLRVDSPTDIFIVHQGDPLLEGIKWKGADGRGEWNLPSDNRSADQCKESGNKNFVSKNYLAADRDYSSAINRFGPSKQTLLHLLNRSEVMLRLERFNAAARDARSVIELLDPSISDLGEQEKSWITKALLRHAKALYALKRWNDAHDEFAKLESFLPSESKEGMARCQSRIRETMGHYDIVEMYQKSIASSSPKLDAADFVGRVEVKEMPERGGGRGVIATADIRPGDLIMACKAFSIVYKTDLPEGNHIMSLNLKTKLMDTDTQYVLRKDVAYRLFDRPEDTPKIFNLYAGPSSKRTSYRFHGEMEDLSNGYVDPQRVDSVTTFNAFGPAMLRKSGFVIDKSKDERASALYDRSSLINHSCCPNATWISLGDVQMIRAIRPIPKGEEVMISYTGQVTFNERSKNLEKFLKPQICQCQLCEEDRADGPENNAVRAQLVSNMDVAFGYTKIGNSSKANEIQKIIASVEKWRNQMEATYGSHRTMKPELSAAYQRLSFCHGLMAKYKRESSYREAIDAMKKSLQHFGIKLSANPKEKNLPIANAPQMHHEEAISGMVQIAGCYAALNVIQMKNAWLTAAEWTCNIEYGGGKMLFMELYGDVLSSLQLA
eukprot:TRINITY_DN8285_c0_g1_i1.p1 TRINITY_DN8285_c0_g1~~TRINITY_DN8285_c0_g1_i1.p1  ORF type:complete len:826 (-),score=159.25 TRINITY_DN8285_c0_g1_i1:24-2501(-)